MGPPEDDLGYTHHGWLPLPRPDLQAWARAHRTELKIPVLKSYEDVYEDRMVAECGSGVSCKTLLQYVDDKLLVPVQFGTDRDFVSGPNAALLVE